MRPLGLPCRSFSNLPDHHPWIPHRECLGDQRIAIVAQTIAFAALQGVLISVLGTAAHGGEAVGNTGETPLRVTVDLKAPDQCYQGSAMPVRVMVVNTLPVPYALPPEYPALNLVFDVRKESAATSLEVELASSGPHALNPGPVIAAGARFVTTLHVGRHVSFAKAGRFDLPWSASLPYKSMTGAELLSTSTGILHLNVLPPDDAHIARSLREYSSILKYPDTALGRIQAIDAVVATGSPLVIPYLGRLIADDEVVGVIALGRFRDQLLSETVLNFAMVSPSGAIIQAALDEFAKRGKVVGENDLRRLLSAKNPEIVAATLDYLRETLVPHGDLALVKKVMVAEKVTELADNADTLISGSAQLLLHRLSPSYPLRLNDPADEEKRKRALLELTANGF